MATIEEVLEASRACLQRLRGPDEIAHKFAPEAGREFGPIYLLEHIILAAWNKGWEHREATERKLRKEVHHGG